MARAFVIRPFGTKLDSSGIQIDFERVHQELIAPALEEVGLGGGTTGELVDSGNIREDMFSLIFEADLVVCDITIHNANVFYELGIRHALRKKRTVLIKGTPTKDGTPFDLLTDRYLAYEIDKPSSAKEKLSDTILASLSSDRPTDSPVFQMLPALSEADPSTVVVVPLDFREEVTRAIAGSSAGWLRLLAEEVKDRRFQWEGLKLVAYAQWQIKDYDGARESWEEIREVYPFDIEANFALANIFERLYRERKGPELLASSNQAIERVLSNRLASSKERAEALSLKGRNEKTCWRLELENLSTIEERRAAALNRGLIRCYEAYRDAFFEDFNHFYPGLNALQMGTIILDLGDSDAWFDVFDSDEEAKLYRDELEKQVSALRYLTSSSVQVGLRRLDDKNPELIWAKVSAVDFLFLTEPKRAKRVLQAYRDAIPSTHRFVWDAVRGQLALFAALGIQTELANTVITEMDALFGEAKKDEPTKSIHLVLFAGHRVDTLDRRDLRFPPSEEEKAKALTKEALSGLRDIEHEVILLASAAPGADILAHEICVELGLTSIICLPMSPEAFGGSVFKYLDNWRTRYLDLLKRRKHLELCKREGLPHWLKGSGTNSWERGNRWVMEMARTWGAERITLLVLWDGKEEGDGPGGTAHMVKLAEATGKIHIMRIDSTQLLK